MANLGYLQLVRHCNQRCRICSNPETPSVLSLDAAVSAIDDFVHRGYTGVILTGGEPSLSDIVEDVVRYALRRGLAVRMISNGSRLARKSVALRYIEAGLRHFHVSLYSSRASVHDYITTLSGSFDSAMRAIRNLAVPGVVVNVNTVINKLNCDHLDEVAELLIKELPFVSHLVINNLDPSMGRAVGNKEMIHRLTDMECSLRRAMALLSAAGRTFRIERVPLCFMVEHAHASTETRKIVKGEERIVHFLDDKGMVRQTSFRHHKADVCRVCTLDSVCAGLFEMGGGYDERELAPVFVDPQPIVDRVLSEGRR